MGLVIVAVVCVLTAVVTWNFGLIIGVLFALASSGLAIAASSALVKRLGNADDALTIERQDI